MTNISDFKLNLEKISSFKPVNDCYAITSGQITKNTPQLALSCYDDRLYIYNPDGNKVNIMDWSTNFTCLAIGDIKGTKDNCLVTGSVDGFVRVIDGNGRLVWSVELSDTIKSVDLGDFDFDHAVEVLVAAQSNTAILIKSDGSIVWRKNFPSTIVTAQIADIDQNDQNNAIVYENDGKIHILNAEGELERTINIGMRISRGCLLRIGRMIFVATSSTDTLRIWDISDNPKEVFKFQENDRIRILTSGKLFDSKNDSLVIMTKNGQISILRAVLTLLDSEGLNKKEEFADRGVDLNEVRPLIIELSKSFGVAGIPISRLYDRYLSEYRSRIPYKKFYSSLLHFQSLGYLGGRIDHLGTPGISEDDLLIITADRFFCMFCNTQFSTLKEHLQCDECLRFVCDECYEERKTVGFIECPFCQADSTHFHKT
ncbi:MAG: hypothetical protein ACW98I_01145 [Candidatus Hodarchaeales archaeon]|jgi:hypothetical protein